MSAIDITVVIPCLNEEENVIAISDAVIEQLSIEKLSYEVIFIDNGSKDKTVNLIKTICAGNPHVKLIVNNKNYGQMRSPTHAIFQGCGRAVIGICADFQDPPQLIPQFISLWRAGAEIVLAVRDRERSSFALSALRAVGYAFFGSFADYPVIRGATGFGLYDRRVIDALSQWQEPEPFWRGMLVESGFRLVTLAYNRPQRARGESKNDIFRLLDFAITALGASSKKLLRLPFYVSALITLAIAPILFFTILNTVIGHQIIYLLLTLVFEVIFATIFFVLGVMGEQIRLIAQTVRRVPLVIERERVNFSDNDA